MPVDELIDRMVDEARFRRAGYVNNLNHHERADPDETKVALRSSVNRSLAHLSDCCLEPRKLLLLLTASVLCSCIRPNPPTPSPVAVLACVSGKLDNLLCFAVSNYETRV